MKHINVSVKIIVPVKTIIVRILTCICENGKYLKLFFYDLKIVCDDTVLYVTDIKSIIALENTIATDSKSAASVNHDNKKVRNKMNYILLTLLLLILVLSITIFICHSYTSRSKQKHVGTLAI